MDLAALITKTAQEMFTRAVEEKLSGDRSPAQSRNSGSNQRTSANFQFVNKAVQMSGSVQYANGPQGLSAKGSYVVQTQQSAGGIRLEHRAGPAPRNTGISTSWRKRP